MPAQIEQVLAATWVPEVTRRLPPVPDPWMSVIVPAFNEERAIGQTVRALDRGSRERPATYEIIVVDNASTDGTAASSSELADIESLRVLRNAAQPRQGLLDAARHARGHRRAAPALRRRLRHLAALAGRDGGGWRRRSTWSWARGWARARTVLRKQPLRRRIVGRSFQQLCRLLLSEPTNDLYCGFKLWRADAAAETFSRIRVEGWVFDAEALAMARALGFSIREMGIDWADREGSRAEHGPGPRAGRASSCWPRAATCAARPAGRDIHAAAEPETASRGL